MGRRSIVWALLLIYVTVMMRMTMEVEGSLHRAGGGQYTWNSNVNFSDWATRQQFYSGDWLFFGFDRTRHSILQVNKSSYEKCIATDYIFNVTRGGRDVFQLLQPKPYYFICGREGYCLKGMKLAINVLPAPPPSASSNQFAAHASAAIPLTPANALTFVSATILTLSFRSFKL